MGSVAAQECCMHLENSSWLSSDQVGLLTSSMPVCSVICWQDTTHASSNPALNKYVKYYIHNYESNVNIKNDNIT